MQSSEVILGQFAWRMASYALMRPILVDRRLLTVLTLGLGVVLLSFLSAFFWVQEQMRDAHDSEVFSSLSRDLELRREFDRSGGRKALTDGLAWRLGNFKEESPRFALINADGTPIVGTLDAMPGGRAVLETPDLRLRVKRDKESYQYIVAMRLDDGAFLVTSQRDFTRVRLARDLGWAALGASIILLLIALLAAFSVNYYVTFHLRRISDTAQNIIRGQMTARVPESRRIDALGALSFTFNEMLDQNEALVSGMRTVTESLAHDLRTPLMRLGRSIEAARAADDRQQRDRHMHDAELYSKHAINVFNALVNLARAEAGLSRDTMETINLASLATDLLELFEPLAEERGQRIEHEITPLTIIGHRQILTQAVGNLLENAIKYSPSGTTLLVLVRNDSNGSPEIVVQDRGPGIPEEAREQATRRFVRLENATGESGSGLGLAIAAAVARLHRGRLVLEGAEPGLRVRLQLGTA